MSKVNLLRALRSGVWHINPTAAKAYMPIVAKLLRGESVEPQEENDPRSAAFIVMNGKRVTYSFDDDDGDLVFEVDDPGSYVEVSDGVHVLPIIGPIFKYDSWCETGMKTRANQLLTADTLPQVKSHIILLDSPGGQSSAVEVMQEAIKACEKPVVAVVDGMACSAAMGIASYCEKIYLSNQIDILGSIGTMITLLDDTEYLKSQGLKLIDIYATQSTDKNKDFIDALAGNEQTIKAALLDPTNDSFITSIQGARPAIDEEQCFTGKIFLGQAAIDVGLADEFGNLETVINNMIGIGKFGALKNFANQKGPLSKEQREQLNAVFKKYRIDAVAVEPNAVLLQGGGENPRNIFVYANEGEDLVGKQCVYADDQGNATSENLEDGDHALSDGRTLTSETRDNLSYVKAVTAATAPTPAGPAPTPAPAPPAGNTGFTAAQIEQLTQLINAAVTPIKAEISSRGDVPVASPKPDHGRVNRDKTEDPMARRRAEIAAKHKEKYK